MHLCPRQWGKEDCFQLSLSFLVKNPNTNLVTNSVSGTKFQVYCGFCLWYLLSCFPPIVIKDAEISLLLL